MEYYSQRSKEDLLALKSELEAKFEEKGIWPSAGYVKRKTKHFPAGYISGTSGCPYLKIRFSGKRWFRLS